MIAKQLWVQESDSVTLRFSYWPEALPIPRKSRRSATRSLAFIRRILTVASPKLVNGSISSPLNRKCSPRRSILGWNTRNAYAALPVKWWTGGIYERWPGGTHRAGDAHRAGAFTSNLAGRQESTRSGSVSSMSSRSIRLSRSSRRSISPDCFEHETPLGFRLEDGWKRRCVDNHVRPIGL